MPENTTVYDPEVYRAARSFRPERLTLAREAQGLTQKALAERIDTTPSAVSHFEADSAKPSPDTVARLSLTLGFPPEFFSKELGERLDLEACHFRKLRSTSKRDQRQLLARGDLILSVLREVEPLVNFPEERISALASSVDSSQEIEDLASTVRERLSLGTGPIANMLGILENLGVMVFEIPGHSRELDAFSTWVDGRPTVFLSSEKQSSSRRRFDCAHEFGHLLMHRSAEPGNREHEAQAHRFAGAFLLPAESFAREYPKRLSWGHLRALKRRWKVSLAAMVRRAFDLDLITEATYRRAFVRLNQAGWREREPDEPPTEHPSLLSKAIAALTDAGRWNLEELADASALHLPMLQGLLRATEPQPALPLWGA
jgi:Zn-dependent peptidase ImmA (M78 family)/plasmid maintenance system antidote protein VapI